MKKFVCVVTGNAGFIGSNLADALLAEGHKVIGIDNLSTGKRGNIDPRVEFYEDDIRDISLLEEICDPCDYIFHTAALARIQPSIEDPLESHDVNLTGTLNVLQVARKTGAKVIFSSSSSVYGDRVPFEESDRDNLHPKNPYAIQKLMGEQYIHLFEELYGLKATIFRYFNVYGPRQLLDGAYAAVIGIFLKQAEEGKLLTIVGDGSQLRDFTHVNDIVRGNLLAMENGDGETINLGTGMNISIKQIADWVSDKQTFLPPRDGEAHETLASIGKAKNILGWSPSIFLNKLTVDQMRIA